MNDSTHSILHSAKRFFSGTMLSRIAGMLRDVVMAYAFGTQEAVAAFLVAFRFSHLLRRLLGEGALQSAFIPQFEKLRHQDPKRASTFFKNLTISLSVLLTVIVILTMAGLWGTLAWGHLTSDTAEIVQLTLLMMPSLIFICLFGINASFLQCQKSYFTPSIAPVAFNTFWIIGTICLWNLTSREAMIWLTLFVNLACIAQWAMTVPKTVRFLREMGGTSFGQLKLFSKDVVALLAPLSLGIIGVGASQINNALDAVFARYANPEGPAYLWYSIRLQQLPLALFGIAISGAMLPPLSRAIKSDNWVKFREFLDFALRRSLILMIPITFAILAMGDSSINLIYGHGDFDQEATAGTTLCLWAYGIGLLPMAIVLILAPAFYAHNDYKTPTRASVFCIGLNIFLNFWMVAILDLGAASVAFATSISAWANLFILGFKLIKSSRYQLSTHLKVNFIKISLASLIAFALVIGYNSYTMPENPLLSLMGGSIPEWTRDTVSQLSILMMQTLLFFSCLGILGYVWRIDDLLQFHKSDIKT